MESTRLPAPVVNADSQPYWDAAREGRLVIRQCQACSQLHFMPRHLCPHCWSDQLAWVDAKGTGSIHSFTVVRRASDPAFASQVPYVVALIELDEGPRLMANILGEDALQSAIGDRVRVRFEARGADAKVPQFERTAA